MRIAVAKHCRCGGKVLPLLWHCIAAAVGKFCYGNGIVLRRQRENCATEGEVCADKKTP